MKQVSSIIRPIVPLLAQPTASAAAASAASSSMVASARFLCSTPATAAAAKHDGIFMAFMGAPGVGKGTFANRIGPALNVPNVSTGDLIRDEIKRGSESGRQLKQITDSGGLVPDDAITSMLRNRLSQPDAKPGFLLDGYPRRVSQAERLNSFAELDVVLNITLREDVLIQKISSRRVCATCGANYNLADIQLGEINMPPLLPKVSGVCDKCGGTHLEQRSDDKVETVKQRLEVYKKQTHPLIDFYRKAGILLEFEVKKGIADLPEIQSMLDEWFVKRGKGQALAAAKAAATGRPKKK